MRNSRPFGNLGIGISALASSLKLASALQKLWFCLQKLLFENRIFMFFFVLSYDISTILLQILISLRFPFHSSKRVRWCFRKRLFELLVVFWKNNFSENFCILSNETYRVEFFLSTRADLPGIFPKKLFRAAILKELLSACFCKKELHSTRISGIFQNFKNMQGKARGCNLKTCNLLKGTPSQDFSWRFSKSFRTPLKSLQLQKSICSGFLIR